MRGCGIRLLILYAVSVIALVGYGAVGVVEAMRFSSKRPVTLADLEQGRVTEGWVEVKDAMMVLPDAFGIYDEKYEKRLDRVLIPIRRNEAETGGHVYVETDDREILATVAEAESVTEANADKYLESHYKQIFRKGPVSGMLRVGLSESSDLKSTGGFDATGAVILKYNKSPSMMRSVLALLGGILLLGGGAFVYLTYRREPVGYAQPAQ